jgi:hypothetical protein
MEKKNILVFPCGSEIGLELYRSLQWSTHFNLIGGNSISDHGKYLYQNYVNDIPFITEPDFNKKFNQVIKKCNIDFIFPANDIVLFKLSQKFAKGEIDAQIVSSPLQTCEICYSKKKTYQYFEGLVPLPKVYNNIIDISNGDFPLFLKPDTGHSSLGTHKIFSKKEIEFYLKADPSILILEYLPGKEYTIDCFTDKNGSLRFCEGRERKRTLNGISANTVKIIDSRFTEIAATINCELKFNGLWFFQLKEREHNKLALIEIAPRAAGTMGYHRYKGVNLPLLTLFDFLGFDIEILENNYSLEWSRALGSSRFNHKIEYQTVYMDLDDNLIFENKVNLQMMAFIYQCVNNNIRVILITKNQGDLIMILTKHKLTGIFDEILQITPEDEKYYYIKDKKSIFIDDSFTERKKVHEKCGIHVFDAHMIECLIEVI